ncbi:protein adenylyltransferase SelO [Arenimonas alkanexedens]
MDLKHSYAALPPRFWSAVAPTPVAAPQLLAWNVPLAAALGLDPTLATRAAAVFSGNALPATAQPIAMAYAGHQFGHFVPQLGDGRAILLGEVTDPQGRRFDVQLKGAGPTPYSRNGDGRAAIGPVLREYLISEAMHALGVPTTRALAAVATGEPVFRDGAVPGAVLTRIAASHVRVGSFQFFAAREDHSAVRALVDFVLARHYPERVGTATPALAMLEAVVQAQARLVSAWLQVGFVHGVMNTDNMAVSGETIDYGPCAFLDEYHPAKTFSSIDRQGRYAYGNQPGIAQWNLARLAECLLPLIDADAERAVALARTAIEAFAPAYREHWLAGQRRKLGLVSEEAGDEALAQDFLEALQAVEADYTLAYRALAQAAQGDDGALPKSPAMDAWLARWRERLARDPQPDATRGLALNAANPAVIPRNHLVEAALAAAAEGDMAPFDALLAAVRRPYDDGAGQAAFMVRPDPAQRVTRTFCGT